MHKIKAYYQYIFSQAIVSIKVLQELNDYFVHLVVLEDGGRWICKQLQQDSWLGLRTKTDIEYAQGVAEQVEIALHITKAARRFDNNFVVSFKEKFLLFIPYAEGGIVKPWSLQQSNVLGSKLAAIHQLTHPKDGHPYPALKTQYLPAFCQIMAKQCNDHLYYRSQEWVASHRDLHYENVIWQNPTVPMLIDWDSAGLIHPFVDLIGLAANCCGLALGNFDEDNFTATLQGYKQAAGNLPSTDGVLWQLCSHSWILWMGYCIRRGRKMDAKNTLMSIQLIEKNQLRMQEIYVTI